jgi:hypothetical protein
MPQIREFIEKCSRNLKEHVDRLSSDRIPKMYLKISTKIKRNLGRSLK